MFDAQEILSAIAADVDAVTGVATVSVDGLDLAGACLAAAHTLTMAFSRERGEFFFVSVFADDTIDAGATDNSPAMLRPIKDGVEVLLLRVPCAVATAPAHSCGVLLAHFVGHMLATEFFGETTADAAARFARIAMAFAEDDVAAAH